MDLIAKLRQLEEESRKRGIPIIGSEKGSWLQLFIKTHKPTQILELGTANGYSGIILGSEQSRLTTIEKNAKITEEAKINFAVYNTKATILVGDAVAIVSQLAQERKAYYDLIFIDFAKKKYLSVLDNCLLLVKKGGYIIADNITIAGCADFKNSVLHHPLLKTEIINIGDGLSCSTVLKP